MKFMNTEDIIRQADRNLATELMHWNGLAAQGKGIKNDQYLIYTLGVDNMDGHLNGVLCLNSPDPKALLQESEQFFEADQRGYAVWVRDHADRELERELRSRGYKPTRRPGIAGMMIEERIDAQRLPEGYSVKWVDSEQGVKDFAAVVQDAFNKSDEVLSEMFSHRGILSSDDVKAFVVHEGEVPVAAAMTVLSGDVAGIYYLGTVAEARGKGLGSYVTAVATNKGFDMGADVVILQASLAGERVYERLGYQVITHYRWYMINPKDK